MCLATHMNVEDVFAWQVITPQLRGRSIIQRSQLLRQYIQCMYMMVSDLRIEWDPRKNAANKRKHGVSFEEAATVFGDERALLLDDPDRSDEEDRFILLGLSASLIYACRLPLLSRG